VDEGNQLINPESLAPAIGYSHVVAAQNGRSVYLAGQVACDEHGVIVGESWVDQFDLALSNLVTALTAAHGTPEDIVWMQIFTTDVVAYREARPRLGPVYRRHLGRHYPAMSLYGVTELADEGALVEITGIAVIAT
jgi:enamine deaminase RidA (YjgF/YER057c/UK114 family)